MGRIGLTPELEGFLRELPSQDLEAVARLSSTELMKRRNTGAAPLPSTTFDEASKRIADTAQESSGSRGLTLENVEDVFRYKPWDAAQTANGDIVREALVAAAKAILRCVPEGPARTIALNQLQDARMAANRAITWRGRF